MILSRSGVAAEWAGQRPDDSLTNLTVWQSMKTVCARQMSFFQQILVQRDIANDPAAEKATGRSLASCENQGALAGPMLTMAIHGPGVSEVSNSSK